MKSRRTGPPARGAKPSGVRRGGSPAGTRSGASPGGAGVRKPKDTARWVIGIHSCEETLKVRPKKIRELWLRDGYQDSQALRDLAESAARSRITLVSKPPGVLDKLGSGHQGCALAVTESPEINWEDLKERETALLILCDGIEDPHNLGSILRTAWLAGASGVIIPADRAVGLTPSVCKIASGGAEHVPVESVANLSSQLDDLKDFGFWSYGLSEKGVRVPWDFKLTGKIAWVVGSEGSGLRVPTERACDELVRIPQVEGGSSYNASIALSMALMDTLRQVSSGPKSS